MKAQIVFASLTGNDEDMAEILEEIYKMQVLT